MEKYLYYTYSVRTNNEEKFYINLVILIFLIGFELKKSSLPFFERKPLQNMGDGFLLTVQYSITAPFNFGNLSSCLFVY